jgi:hypothetical protein
VIEVPANTSDLKVLEMVSVERNQSYKGMNNKETLLNQRKEECNKEDQKRLNDTKKLEPEDFDKIYFGTSIEKTDLERLEPKIWVNSNVSYLTFIFASLHFKKLFIRYI